MAQADGQVEPQISKVILRINTLEIMPMTIPQPTPEGSTLVAIDISKLRNDVLIEIPGKTRRIRLTVLNSRAEHDHFLERLARFDRPVIVGFEATGNYHRPLAYRLIEAGFTPRLISSLALARTREALHNGWDKNDPKDAQVILHMLRIGATQVYCDPTYRRHQRSPGVVEDA
jgi:transposase